MTGGISGGPPCIGTLILAALMLTSDPLRSLLEKKCLLLRSQPLQLIVVMGLRSLSLFGDLVW
jgi:hypothetical protein